MSMNTIEWQGRQVELLKIFEWNGHKVKIFEEINDLKFGRVLKASVDYVNTYIIGDTVVTDRDVIDYLDDHYGRPSEFRNLIF